MEKRVTAKADKLSKVTRKRVSSRTLSHSYEAEVVRRLPDKKEIGSSTLPIATEGGVYV